MILFLMKRYVFLIAGWLLLITAVLTLFYQSAALLLEPPGYEASASIQLSANAAEQKKERELLCNRPSFIYSTNVLYPVCDSLGLTKRWSKRYGFDSGHFSLNNEGVCRLLRVEMTLIYFKKEYQPVEINLISEKPEEAVEIVNATAVSLISQFGKLKGSATGEHHLLLQKAVTAQKIIAWPLALVKTLIVVIPCSVGGVILIIFGRRFPPFIPFPPKKNVTIVSKY